MSHFLLDAQQHKIHKNTDALIQNMGDLLFEKNQVNSASCFSGSSPEKLQNLSMTSHVIWIKYLLFFSSPLHKKLDTIVQSLKGGCCSFIAPRHTRLFLFVIMLEDQSVLQILNFVKTDLPASLNYRLNPMRCTWHNFVHMHMCHEN